MILLSLTRKTQYEIHGNAIVCERSHRSHVLILSAAFSQIVPVHIVCQYAKLNEAK